MWGFSSTIASSLLIFVFDLYIFSNAWIVWVLIFPILIFFMPIFSTPLFGINQFWTAPASILLFPGVCSAGQPSAGWPKSSPGWLPPRTDMARFLEGALPILAVAASCREEVPLPCSVKYMYMFWAFVNILSNLAERNTNLRIQSNLCCIIMKKSLTISSDHKFTW